MVMVYRAGEMTRKTEDGGKEKESKKERKRKKRE